MLLVCPPTTSRPLCASRRAAVSAPRLREAGARVRTRHGAQKSTAEG